MKKSDLKSGMSVTTRQGSSYLVLTDVQTKRYGHQDVIFIKNGNFIIGADYTEDLFCETASSLDVVSVSGPVVNTDTYKMKGELIWSREKVIEKVIEKTISELESEPGLEPNTLRIIK